MEALRNLLSLLKEKYQEPRPLQKMLLQKYGGQNYVKSYEDEMPVNGNTCTSVLFTCDRRKNKSVIEHMLLSFEQIEEYAEEINENSAAEKKLLEKYKNELQKLLDKEEFSDGSKLADKYARILKKTLLKLWNRRTYNQILSAYLLENGMETESYESGHRMTDDELCMLDDSFIEAYQVRTEDASQRYVVIEMVQPIIHISYLDDEEENEIEYQDICGICRYYIA